MVAARTVEEGARWVEERLGAPTVAGGKHPLMGTHNRLLSLGPERYPEIDALDPQAPAPRRSRWFDLDSPAMRERLESGPALIHWVERTADIEALRGKTGEIEILRLRAGLSLASVCRATAPALPRARSRSSVGGGRIPPPTSRPRAASWSPSSMRGPISRRPFRRPSECVGFHDGREE